MTTQLAAAIDAAASQVGFHLGKAAQVPAYPRGQLVDQQLPAVAMIEKAAPGAGAPPRPG